MTTSIANNIKLIALATALIAGAATADAAELRKKANSGGAKSMIQKVQPQAGVSGSLSNGAGVADLVILPWHGGNSGQPNSGYCGPWNGGNQKIYFYVKNIGSGIAAASDVYVGFLNDSNSTISVPALAPNQATLRSKTIPLSAWGPSQYHSSVQFLIAADHNDETSETNVTNNYGQSTCNGPAT